RAAVAYAKAAEVSQFRDSLHPGSISHGHGTFMFCVPGHCGAPSTPDEQMRLGQFVDEALRKAGVFHPLGVAAPQGGGK
ncbi:hypothetical protein, partial [Pseudomonas sp.]|uniref:hypothetical protein n=1 Tax=Pseudomonas sp. TaxID=306 RepID=UPI00261AC1C7